MLHQIGIGTLGPVFRTYEPSRDRLVAVKVFRLDIVPEQSRALADALGRAVQASLFHPSIVEPIAAGVEGTLAYRAEEYVAAESLDVAMRHYAPAPVEKVLPFITQLAGAIDFARAAGVGHGALHPRDIFVTPDDARATGFGVIEALEEIGVRAPVRRPYTAPERIEGHPWGTPADIFSLAAITFELLTGRRPSGTGAQIGALPDGGQASAMHAVLARAMDEDPARRYGSALAFAAALESASRGEPESAAASELTAIAMAAPAPVAAAPAPTPGEFEIERRLEPPPAPADQPRAAVASASVPPTLFDSGASEEPVDAMHEEPAPFADEFVEDPSAVEHAFAEDEFVKDDETLELVPEQTAAGEDRRPLQPFEPEAPPQEAAIQEHEPAYAAEEPASPHDLGIDAHESAFDFAERGHPGVLPMALVGLLCLLVGFGLGYFVRGHNQPPLESATADAAPVTTAPAAAAPAPRAYSDQNVSAPPPGAAGSPSGPPSTAPAEPPSPVSEAPLSAAAPPVPTPKPTTEARTGRLVIRSTPEHAGVVVNGTWRGRTPLTLEKLPFGRYAVRIVEPGYVAVNERVSLDAANAEHIVGARLEKQERAVTHEPAAPARAAASELFTGTLYVDSRPQGATVLLDNRPIGKTPLTLPDVRIGMHVVRIEMAGKQPWTATARVVAGETARVTGSLEDK